MMLFFSSSYSIVHVRAFSALKAVMESPSPWKKQWKLIEKMRQLHPAAVDTMGADALASRYDSTAEQFRFQTLIATMLSPQTRDQQTTKAFDNLVELLSPAPFLASSILSQDPAKIEEAIQPVSFYKTKSKNIIDACEKCVKNHNNDIPEQIEDLLAFKGVGPKIAYLTFSIARNQTLGICVDTHVHRITNRLGWVDTWQAKSNGPEKTRLALEALLPKDQWEHVNGLIVGFGQTVCEAQRPKCAECALSSSCKYFNDPTHMRKTKQ